MDFKENKTFEELLREKIQNHEFPFEENGWAKMQSKLKAHHAQTAVSQTSIYKSLLLKAGKILVTVVSGSAIVYSALSLSGALDKNTQSAIAGNDLKLENAPDLKQEAISPEKSVQQNSAMLSLPHVADAGKMNPDMITGTENDVDERKTTAVSKDNSFASAKQNLKHFPAGTYMQNADYQNNNKNTKVGIPGNKDKKATDNFVKIAENNIINNQEKSSPEKVAYTASAKNASVKDIPQQKDVNTFAENSEKMVDAIDSAIMETGKKYPEKPNTSRPKAKILFAVSAGINNNFLSTTDASAADGIKTSFTGGINASAPLSDKFAVSAGAQYVSQAVNVSHTSAIVRYGILQDSSVTRTSFSSCKYIAFPLFVKYAFLPKMSLHTGLRTAILMGANADVSELRYSNKRLISSTPIEEGGKFAQFNGLRTVDISLPLGLEFDLHRRLSISATYFYGLSDYTRNEVFSNSRRDRQTSFQFQLNYKPF